MIDNFIKVILLTPDVIFDVTVGEIGTDGIYRVFKQYEKLDKISADTLLKNNGRISFLEIPNSLFDYITSKLIIQEGQLKLSSHMHIFQDEQKIILCVPYKEFQRMVGDYKEVLLKKQALLIRDLNAISEEMVIISKLNLETETASRENKE